MAIFLWIAHVEIFYISEPTAICKKKKGILRAEKVRETHKKPKSKPSLKEPIAAHQHKFSDSLSALSIFILKTETDLPSITQTAKKP